MTIYINLTDELLVLQRLRDDPKSYQILLSELIDEENGPLKKLIASAQRPTGKVFMTH